MKIIYKDGTEQTVEANVWNSEDYPDGIMGLIKRTYDSDEDYSEDDDEELFLINENEIRCINLK